MPLRRKIPGILTATMYPEARRPDTGLDTARPEGSPILARNSVSEQGSFPSQGL